VPLYHINNLTTIKSSNMENEITNIAEISISYIPAFVEDAVIKTSWAAQAVLRRFFPQETIHIQERFVVMYMNKANKVLGVFPMSVGGISGTVADVRLILAVALKTGATNLMLCHNHPSGSLEPSFADLDLTNRVKEGALLLEIKLLDHLILAPEEGQYYSFADEGGV
jgi:DNA repair protein RadC